VTSENWRDHARGTIMGAMRDGEYLAFDLLLMDQATIDKVNAGKRELSNGYAAALEFGDFKSADGTACQARQARITDGNHVALVKFGRAGGDCAIKDGFATCDALPPSFLDGLNKEKPVKTMLIDGLTVDIANADTAHATITTILAARDAATAKVTDLQNQVATLTTEAATKDAKIATLEQQVADSKPTPAQLRDAAKAYAQVCDKAKALGVQFAEDADPDAIMAAVVDNHFKGTPMANSVKDWSADQIAASFAVLTKDAKPGDPVREVFRDGIRQPANGTQAVDAQRRRWLADKANAHRTTQAA
jgi:hypothetical protein